MPRQQHRVTQGFAGKAIQRAPQTQEMAFCAMRSVHTAWCDQISTPAENQLRFTVPSTDTVVLRLSLVSTNRHVADRSPLPERRGNNAQQPTNDREQA